ncbi:type III secretion system inner rod subunit SctI [Shewanella violacea]|uniref:type III secretion system inner rod subunit SctI n=1 Tax=Shewanella violacea TaxID=60217 RepID=UPI00030B132A|nr:type III secretion system inner rod subunit SctI [Shewanella violacea]
MDIQSVSELAKVAADKVSQLDAKDTDSSLVEKFSKLMELGTPAIKLATDMVTLPGMDNPLMKATKAFSSKSASDTVTVSPVDMTNVEGVSYSPSPEAMLGGQMLMGKAVIEVDLVAKTAGSLSQSINKLVNMQ